MTRWQLITAYFGMGLAVAAAVAALIANLSAGESKHQSGLTRSEVAKIAKHIAAIERPTEKQRQAALKRAIAALTPAEARAILRKARQPEGNGSSTRRDGGSGVSGGAPGSGRSPTGSPRQPGSGGGGGGAVPVPEPAPPGSSQPGGSSPAPAPGQPAPQQPSPPPKCVDPLPVLCDQPILPPILGLLSPGASSN